MRHLGIGRLGGVATLMTAAVLTAAVANATPNVNSAVLIPYVFDNDPFSTLTQVDNYPASIVFDDLKTPGALGFANRHVWRFSVDDVNAVDFANEDNFSFCADLLITGGGEAEAGLQVSPWWSILVDGMFNVRTTDGEVAAFGGRLPFYSFTANHGVVYAKGNVIRLEIIYLANSNSSIDPATIEYRIVYLGNPYTSGPIAFDEGNPAENPPHGVWGMLSPAGVGGYVQYFLGGSPDGGNARAEWSNICFEDLGVVPVQPSTWSQIKSIIR